MRAVLLHAFGPTDVLMPAEVPAPRPGPGQVAINVEFASVTFVDTQIRAGAPPNPAMAPALPAIPGNGVGGIVAAVGADVDPALVGWRRCTGTRRYCSPGLCPCTSCDRCGCARRSGRIGTGRSGDQPETFVASGQFGRASWWHPLARRRAPRRISGLCRNCVLLELERGSSAMAVLPRTVAASPVRRRTRNRRGNLAAAGCRRPHAAHLTHPAGWPRARHWLARRPAPASGQR